LHLLTRIYTLTVQTLHNFIPLILPCPMHTIQEKLLKIIEQKNIGDKTLREIGEMIGEEFPQKIKHHLTQLEKKGFIKLDKKNNKIEKKGRETNMLSPFISIPIVGMANCGPATIFADQNIEGYLKVSRRMVPKSNNLFAIQADGISMNKALVNNKTIDDGDYLIIDSSYLAPKNKDIVLSIIDENANIKRFIRNEDGSIVLMSDSTREFAPIYIHEDDDFLINGKVVDVIKKPKI
jgi:repressor LexA